MSHATRLIVCALLGCLLLPTVAALAAQAVPWLISLLVFLAIAALAWPGSWRRR